MSRLMFSPRGSAIGRSGKPRPSAFGGFPYSGDEHKPVRQDGFILMTALAFLIVLSIIGLSLTHAAIQTLNLGVRHSYTQVAHIASKAAIDYAEEQYELDPSYNGTPEQDLTLNANYRVTIEVVVLYAEGSSAKRVQAFGRVYIPETSPNADFVRDIKSSIIRNGEVIGTADPADYNPVLWLDANEPNSLHKTIVSTQQYVSGLPNSTNKDLVEEGGSDATTTSNRGKLFFSTDDIEMSWDGNTLGHQWTGLRFRSINTPRNATVQQAYLQFTADETKQAGAVQLQVKGIAQDNPAVWSANYDVSTRTKTTASVTWTPPNWNVVGASGANERVDITAIVQELVNRGGWNPGQAMAFSISWITGSGVRTAEMGDASTPAPQLFISWQEASSNFATADGDSVQHWNDISINDNDAKLAYGTAPVLKLNQINGLKALRFSGNGTLKSALATTMTGNAATAYMVMLPRTASQTSARFISLMNTGNTSDEGNANGLVPLFKNGSTTTIQQRYNATNGRSLSGAIDGAWAMYSSIISNAANERILKNATPDNTGASISPVGFTVNEIYVGGTRNASSGYRYADMDVAEVIVFNQALSCTQTQDIENYFSLRYNITIGTKTC